ASDIVKWIFADRAEEAHALQAFHIPQLIKESRVTVVQPPHWLAEVVAVIVRLDPGRARQAASLLHALEFSIVTGVEVYHKACVLWASLKHLLFDPLSHAVILTAPGAFFVTADEQYYNIIGRPTESVGL